MVATAILALTSMIRRKLMLRMIQVVAGFMPKLPTKMPSTRACRPSPDREPKPTWKQHQQQERHRRHAAPENGAAACIARRNVSVRNAASEIIRIVDSQRPPHHFHRATPETEGEQGERRDNQDAACARAARCRREMLEDRSPGEGKSRQRIELATLDLRRGRHDAPGEYQRDQAERDIDVEDPVPRKIGCDEATKRRAQAAARSRPAYVR